MKMEKVFQVYSKYIFTYSSDFTTKVRESLTEMIKTKVKAILPADEFAKLFEDDSPSSDLEDMLESEEFEECIKTLHTLCLNMTLSDPPVTIELMDFVHQDEAQQTKSEEEIDIDMNEVFKNLIVSMSYDKTKHE